MKKNYFLTLILSVFAIPAFTQINQQVQQLSSAASSTAATGCATEVTPQQVTYEMERDHQAYEQLKQSLLNNAPEATTEYLIQLHLLRNDNGTTSSSVTLAQIRSEIANYVNPYFNTATLNASFVECGPVLYHNSTAYNSLSSTTEGDNMASAYNVPNVINLYFVDYAQGYCGWANFPSYLPKDYVVLAYGCATNQSTFVHELGHYFDVYHTHQAGSLGVENVTRNPADACYNAATSGDMLADTDADPVLSGKVNSSCVASGLGNGPCGLPYTPDPNNIMSYSVKACRTVFSPGQQTRMAAAMATSRSYLLTGCSAYCASAGTNSNAEWIDDVSVGSFSNLNSGASGYSDFTSQTVNISSGQSYPISLTPGYSSTNWVEYWRMWIDFNGDDDFDDAGELVYDVGPLAGTVTGTLVVPPGVSGTTRMRISMKYGSSPTPCETFSLGEVEDYTVNIYAGLPDYIPIDLALSSTAISPGSSTTASCKIENIGPAAGGASVVVYYLSSNTTLDGGDIRLGDNTVGGLSWGATSGSKSASLTIPASTTPGAYYILFHADGEYDVSESSGANNFKSLAITVLPPSQSDLLPISIVLGSSSASSGSSVSASCKVRNIGAGASSSSSVGFYLSTNTTFDGGDVQLGTASVGGLAVLTSSGTKSASLTIPAGTPSGTYYILYVADEYNTESESDEANNVKNQQIAVTQSGGGPQSDLLPISIVLGSSSASSGSSVSASCKVRNIGAGASSSSSVGFYLSTNTTFDGSDVQLGSASVGGLAVLTSSGTKSASLTIPAGTPSGTYYILYVADEYNTESESDEANNVKNQQIAVTQSGGGPQADLLPISIVLGSSSASSGSSVSASCKVRNIGAGASSSSSVGFYLSTNTTFDGGDVQLGSASVGGLAIYTSSGTKSASLTIPAGTPSGTYYILYVADEYNTESESDEANNVKNQQIAVTQSGGGPQSDLLPISIVLGSSSASSGSSVSASCKVRNIGAGASSSSSVGFYLSTNTTFDGSDVQLGSASVGGLAVLTSSGTKSASLTIPAGTPSGTYYILYVADEYNTESESDEANNVKDRQITVSGTGGAQPDLVPINLVMGSTTVNAGSAMTVSCRVKNIGTGTSSSNSLGFYLSSNTTLDGSDTKLDGTTIGGQAAGATSGVKTGSLTIPAGTPNGTYYILFAADEYNTESESDEVNNVKDRQITVSAIPLLDPSKTEIVSNGLFDLKQYPNPTQGELFVEFTSLMNSSEKVELHIYDASGRLMLNREFNDVQQGSKYELDVSKFATGIYNVVYKSTDNVITKKLIITK